MRGNGDEVRRQWFDVAELARDAEQEVLVEVVEARQGADGVAGIGAHTEFVDPPDVDGDAHGLSVNRRRFSQGCKNMRVVKAGWLPGGE